MAGPNEAGFARKNELDYANRTDTTPPQQHDSILLPMAHDWSRKRKWSIIFLVALMSLTVAISLVINAPASHDISQDLNNRSAFLSVFFITVPNLGQVVGAFYVGPLSERFGRVPVLHSFNVLWLVFTLAGGFSTNISQITVFRFFTGAFVSSINLNPAIAGDLFLPHQRGFALSIAGLVPLAGSAIGPLVGGYITEYLNWRWTFHIVAILGGALVPVSIFVLKETYAPVLQRRALKARGMPQGQGERPALYRHGLRGAIKTMSLALVRPFVVLAKSSLAVGMGLYLAICFSYLSILNSTNASVFQDVYGFSAGTSGLVYLSTTAGTLVGSLYCSFALDYFLQRGLPYRKRDATSTPRPENRLVAVIPALIVFPIGVLVYGWALEKRVHFALPLASTFLYGFSLTSATLPIMAYIVDLFGNLSASAIGAVLPLRYLAGALLPIATPYMYARLGYGWSNTLLALILVALAPIILWAIVKPPPPSTPADAEDSSSSG
ncbi:MFS general substrate transporter [Xylariaceae sp. FL1019]|nr:MFS general substrate transporter [Xylariaceae sp. FL1019]